MLGFDGRNGTRSVQNGYLELTVCSHSRPVTQLVAQVKDYFLYEKNLMPSNLDILNLERGIYELLDGVDSIEARLNRILDSLKPDD